MCWMDIRRSRDALAVLLYLYSVLKWDAAQVHGSLHTYNAPGVY